MDLNELLSHIPMDQVAQQLGVSTDEAEKATKAALPALVQGMQANASAGGADSLAQALDQHAHRLTPSGLNLNGVDTDDGDKIVRNVFGDNRDQVVNQLGGLGGLNSGLIGKLLPLLAPLVMGWLGSKIGGSKKADTSEKKADAPAEAPAEGGGLGDLLGGLLGGGSGGGGGLGDLLGGLLGGGRKG